MRLFIRQFTSFSVIGAVATAVHFAILVYSVQSLKLDPVLGSIAGFIVGAITNYILNYHFTFRSNKNHLETSLKFFSVALVGLGLNTLLMYITMQWLHYLVSQAVATAIVLLWNFLCNRFWTFREARFVKQ